jgi:hypothetical protein
MRQQLLVWLMPLQQLVLSPWIEHNKLQPSQLRTPT